MLPSLYHGTLPLILEGEGPADTPNGTLDTLPFEILVPAGESYRTALAEAGIIKLQRLTGTTAEVFPYYALFVQDLRVRETSDSVLRIAVNTVGLLVDSEKRKTTIASSGGRSTIGPEERRNGILRDGSGNIVKTDMSGFIVPPGGGTPVPREQYPSRIFDEETTVANAAWTVTVPRHTLTSTWFTTTRPDHLAVGSNITPPYELDEPEHPFDATKWEDLQLRRNDPYGWVLDSRNIEMLFEDTTPYTGPNYAPPPLGGTSPLPTTGLFAVTDTISYYLPGEPV